MSEPAQPFPSGQPPRPGAGAPGEVPPPPVEVTHGDSEQSAASKFPWGGLTGAMLIAALIAAGWWWQGQPSAPAPVAQGAPPYTPSATPASTRPPGLPRAAAADAVTAPVTDANLPPAAATAPSRPVPVEPQPDPALLIRVRAFAISAVMPGPQGRAMIDGRMKHLGDEVLPGLTLAETTTEEIVFRDQAGALYRRRF